MSISVLLYSLILYLCFSVSCVSPPANLAVLSRFVSSKSGKIYLHTDIRMLIFRKSDADAATLHKTSVPYELRSFTHGPTNPKFSPRK